LMLAGDLLPGSKRGESAPEAIQFCVVVT